MISAIAVISRDGAVCTTKSIAEEKTTTTSAAATAVVTKHHKDDCKLLLPADYCRRRRGMNAWSALYLSSIVVCLHHTSLLSTKV